MVLNKIWIKIKKLFSFSLIGFIEGHRYLSKNQIAIIRSQVGKNAEETVIKFECEFSKLVGLGDALSFASGRMAFYAFMKSMDIGEGDEVILCGYTCSVMPDAVLRLGAKPVYSDVDVSTFGSSPNSIKQCLSSKTKLVVAQHSFGIPCEIDKIQKICSANGVTLLEDCALALGSKLNNRKVGTFGDAAIFSSDHSKPINTIIGGFIYSEDKEIMEKISFIQRNSSELSLKKQKAIWSQFIIERCLAQPYRYGLLNFINSLNAFFVKKTLRISPFLDEDDGSEGLSSTYPYPSKLPGFLAFIGLYELERWEFKSEERRQSIKNYLEEFNQANLKDCIPEVYLDKDRSIIPLRFVYTHSNALNIRSKLSKLINIDEIWFTKPIINSSAPLENFLYEEGRCPESERIGDKIINLPLIPFPKIAKIIKKLHEIF